MKLNDLLPFNYLFIINCIDKDTDNDVAVNYSLMYYYQINSLSY
jgi:hypothetical protein